MANILNRYKDVQYSIRIASQIAPHRQMHRSCPVVYQFASRLPETERCKLEITDLLDYGCQTRMHVVHCSHRSWAAADHHALAATLNWYNRPVASRSSARQSPPTPAIIHLSNAQRSASISGSFRGSSASGRA